MKKYNNVNEIREALKMGLKVYWMHEGYEVLLLEDPVPYKNLYSHRDGKMLRVTFVSNWFGSRITKSCINDCFSK